MNMMQALAHQDAQPLGDLVPTAADTANRPDFRAFDSHIRAYDRRRWRAGRAAQRGMTLIEIMVVIVIIGVLGSALAVGVFGMLADAKTDTAKAQINTIGAVIEAHEARNGDYPESLEELTEGKRAKLKKSNLKDPWRRELQYSAEGDGFTLCSGGDDKKMGTEDDYCYGDEDN